MGKLKKAVLGFLLCFLLGSVAACAGKDTGEVPEPTATRAPEPTKEPVQEPEITPEATATQKPTATPVPEKTITEMTNLTTASPDGNTVVKIWVDEDGFWSYSVTDRDKKIIEMSKLGMVMQEGNLFRGLSLVEDSVETGEIKETYELFTGNNEVLEN